MDIAGSLNPLSQHNLQQVAAMFQHSKAQREMTRRLVQSEAQIQSPMLEGLKQAEAVARFRMQVCLNIGAAWRRLPLEIWDRIFTYYLFAIRSGLPGSTFDDTNRMAMSAPGTLSLVSKFWRAVVLAVPSIWKDVTVPVFEHPSNDSSPIVPIGRVESLLSRLNRIYATPHSLSLTISLPKPQIPTAASDVDDEESTVSQPATQLVTDGIPVHIILQCHPIVPVVERVCAFVPRDQRKELGTHLGPLKFSSASSLVIVGLGPLGGADSAVRFPAVKNAVLIDAIYGLDIPTSFPWAQLTNLLLGDNIGLKKMYSVLSMCTSLVRGSFWLHEEFHENAPTATPTTLHFLRELSIIQYKDVNPERHSESQGHHNLNLRPIPCPNLSFPALSELRVFGDDISFGTFSNLTRLTAIGAFFPYDLDTILDSCPSLVELFVSISLWDNFSSNSGTSVISLVYNPDRPRGKFLQVIALMCTAMSEHDINNAIRPLCTVVSSRTVRHGTLADTENLSPLKRLFVRYQADSEAYFLSDGVLQFLAERTSVAFQPFRTDRLELLCQSLTRFGGSHEYWPRLDRDHIKHWEDGMMDILEENWQYTTRSRP